MSKNLLLGIAAYVVEELAKKNKEVHPTNLQLLKTFISVLHAPLANKEQGSKYQFQRKNCNIQI